MNPHPSLNQSASGSGGVGSSNQEIFSQRGAYLVPSTGDIAHCLNAGGMGWQDYETETMVVHGTKDPCTDKDLAFALGRNSGQENAIAFGVAESPDLAHCLRSGASRADKHESTTYIAGSAVRRLTPVECERLQGFPDNYTRIPWRGKPAEDCPDGPRYKAIGNSWAVPKFRWLGQRIEYIDGLMAAMNTLPVGDTGF